MNSILKILRLLPPLFFFLLFKLFFYYVLNLSMLYSTAEYDGVLAVYSAATTTLRPVPQTVPLIARLLPQPLLSGTKPSRLSTTQEVRAGTPRHDRTGQLEPSFILTTRNVVEIKTILVLEWLSVRIN